MDHNLMRNRNRTNDDDDDDELVGQNVIGLLGIVSKPLRKLCVNIDKI